jgi:hypothetical protein
MYGSCKEVAMLWIVFVILVVLWLLGLATAYTFGGFIHLLLVIALTVLLVQLMDRRRIV